MANTYQITKEINKKMYTAQFGGLSVALKAVDASYIDGTSTTSVEKLAKYLFDHVIVEPKGLTIDDFEDLNEFNEVVSFARGVMQGEFRKEAERPAAEAKGRK